MILRSVSLVLIALCLIFNSPHADSSEEYVCEGEGGFKNVSPSSNKLQQYGVQIRRIVKAGDSDDTRLLTAEEKEIFNFAGVIMAPGTESGTGFVAYSRLTVVTVAHAFYARGKLHTSLDKFRFVIGEDLREKGKHKKYKICELWVGTTHPRRFKIGRASCGERV